MDSNQEQFINDPRNCTYWNPSKSTVLRAWPINDRQVELYDCITGNVYKLSNLEINLKIRNGELIYIDPFKPKTLPVGGKTPARLTTPESEGSLVGKYAKTSNSLAGKYARNPGAAVSGSSRRSSGGASAGTTGGDTGHAASASPVERREVGEIVEEPAPSGPPSSRPVTSSLIGKYARKK